MSISIGQLNSYLKNYTDAILTLHGIPTTNYCHEAPMDLILAEITARKTLEREIWTLCQIAETAPPLKPETNFDFITLPKNDNGHYECERCQTEFSDPSEVCWAEVGDFSKDVGVPLCADCCEDQIENWSEINDETDEE
jgi:hypothetical protein